MTEAHEYMQALGLEPVQYGPSLPIAYCKCGTRFTFEPARWSIPGAKGWRCHCEGCVDGEYIDGVLRGDVRSGEGDSPWEALDDCAAMCWDIHPEELLEKP